MDPPPRKQGGLPTRMVWDPLFIPPLSTCLGLLVACGRWPWVAPGARGPRQSSLSGQECAQSGCTPCLRVVMAPVTPGAYLFALPPSLLWFRDAHFASLAQCIHRCTFFHCKTCRSALSSGPKMGMFL